MLLAGVPLGVNGRLLALLAALQISLGRAKGSKCTLSSASRLAGRAGRGVSLFSE